MKRVFWVFGTSAAGKETFIRAATQDAEVAALLGGGRVAASQESLAHIGQYDGDPVTQRREGILAEVPLLLQTHDIVLIKWQIVDSMAGRPQRLSEALPAAEHRIVELQAPMPELIRRLHSKPWWTDADRGTEESYLTEELALVARHIDALPQRRGLLRVDSGQRTYAVRPPAPLQPSAPGRPPTP